MNAGNLDKLVMLLSTDWFLPYWYTVGITIAKENKEPFQAACREIVKQIMSGAKEYWNISFADERVNETYSMVQTALQKCHANKLTIDRIKALIAGEEISYTDEATGWLVLTITEQFIKDALEEAPPLNISLRRVMKETWDRNRLGLPDVTLRQAAASSASEWDAYIRSTTPDLVTRIPEYLFGITSKDKFDLFWTDISTRLSATERRELLSWYRKVGESMTGEPLRLPQEV
jgi:hypothetical protein